MRTAPSQPIAAGSRIRHSMFGLGTVREVEGNKLRIDFDSGAVKRVIDSFVEPV